MNDLISRQAAIDAINTHFGFNIEEEYGSAVQEVINGLPSAQSEIIRCKDCRWAKEACGGNIECFVDSNIPEYHGYEWFCPNGERRIDG